MSDASSERTDKRHATALFVHHLLFSQKPWFTSAFIPDSLNVIQYSPTVEEADQLKC